MPGRRPEKDPDEGLPRLPPGRHGLPREFVIENQRARITAGMIAAVVADGYTATTVATVCAAAGLSRRTFYGAYSDKRQAFDHAYSEVTGFLLEAMLEARERERSRWAGKVQAQLGALLGCFEENPDLAIFSLAAPPAAGGEVATGGREFLDSLIGQLVEGRPRRSRRAPPATGYFLAGGLSALITEAFEVPSAPRLPALLPELTRLVLAPYLGQEAAAVVAV